MINEINCKDLAKRIMTGLKETINREGLNLTLTIIRVGDDSSSTSYIKQIKKYCYELGVALNVCELPPEVTTEDVIAMINHYEPISTGIMVQMPLPAQVDARAVTEAIPPEKDIDGITNANMGKLASNCGNYFVPCTAKAVIKIIEDVYRPFGSDLSGFDIAVFGRSNVVGKPLALELMNRNATVQIVHSNSFYAPIGYTRKKQIVVSAMGKPHKLTADDFSTFNDCIVDCGVTMVDGKLKGDVNLQSLRAELGEHKDMYVTPVPGGVGAVTTAMLMENLIEAYHRNRYIIGMNLAKYSA